MIQFSAFQKGRCTCVKILPGCFQNRESIRSPLALEFLEFSKSIVSSCQTGVLTSIYSHDNRESYRELRFNCYGFIAYLLQRVFPRAYETVLDFMFTHRDQIPVSIDQIPCPFHYSAFFSSLGHCKNKLWSSFSDFKTVRPGDLMVYLPRNYVPKEIAEIPSGRTGTHIMIIQTVEAVKRDRVELIVIDCTRFRHCNEDSRAKGGIGRAPLTVFSEPEGTVLQWGSRKKRWEKDLFFGRLNEVQRTILSRL